MNLEEIRARLMAYRAALIDERKVARASVAMVLGAGPAGVQLLLIQRALRDNDPWSGHMALPGGRRDPDDADVIETAIREAREEVGIDLAVDAEAIGRLDELRAIARDRPLDLVISPVVFALHRPVALTLCPREVDSAVWVPLSFLATGAARATYRRTLDGRVSEFPAFQYERYTVWGLTHRIVEEFLAVANGAPARG